LPIDSAAGGLETAAMQLPLFTGIAVVAFLVLLRHSAGRRVAASEGQFIWLMFVPTLIGGFAILGVGIEMLVTVPAAGVVMAITGSVYLAALIGFLTRASRSVTASGPQALTEPLADYLSTLMGLLLIGGLAALVGLIVWGVSQAAR
jgi:hypothetical protein